MRGRNKAVIVRAIEEYLKGQCEEAIQQLYASDCVALGPDVGGGGQGLPLAKNTFSLRDHSLMYKSAFPDMEFRVDEIVEEGGRVAVRWSVRGGDCGNDDAIRIRRHLAVDEAGFSANGVAFCHMRDGKIVKIWQLSDMVTLLRRFGAGRVEEGITV